MDGFIDVLRRQIHRRYETVDSSMMNHGRWIDVLKKEKHNIEACPAGSDMYYASVCILHYSIKTVGAHAGLELATSDYDVQRIELQTHRI